MRSRQEDEFTKGTERYRQRRRRRRRRPRRRIKRSNDHQFLDVVEVVAVGFLILLVVTLVTMTLIMVVMVVDAVHVRSSTTGTTAFTASTKKKKKTTTTTTTTKAFLFSSPSTPSRRRHCLFDTSTISKFSTKAATTTATTGNHSPTSSSSVALTNVLWSSTVISKPRPGRCGASLLATTTSSSSSPSSLIESSHQDDDENTKKIQRGLYIHIPYCRQRCHYCDFAIVPIGNGSRSRTVPISGSVESSSDDPARNVYRKQTTGNGTSNNTHRQDDGFRRMDRRYTDAVCKELRTLQQQKTSTTTTSSTTNTSGSSMPTTTTVETSPEIFISSLYFGGGTPSLMPVESIQRIVETAFGTDRKAILDDDAPKFILTSDAEVTMEMDPGTFTKEHLCNLKQRIGINRISLGVQSFDDQILTTMGRTHRSQDVYQSIEDIQQVFGPSSSSSSVNYSIDLISGAVPGLTPIKWMLTLQHALTQLPIQPKHISIYDLQIEEGTKFAKLYGNLSQQDNGCTGEGSNESKHTPSLLPTDDDCAFMYKYTAGYLKAKGYEHYEVSSYALLEHSSTVKPNGGDSAGDDPTSTTAPTSSPTKRSTRSPYRSRHNQVYWAYDAEWYAVGLGASSFVNGRTLKRPRAMSDYIRWVDEIYDHQNDVQMNNHDDNNDDSTDDDRLEDILLKRLRTSDGLDLNWISEQYGADTASKILKGCELGFELGMIDLVRNCEDEGVDGNTETDDSEKEGDVNQDNDDIGILKLRDPDGFIYSNYIISGIYTELGLL